MNDRQIQKFSLAFSFLAFLILILAGWLSGARWMTSFFRAGIASIILGLIVWGVGSMFPEKTEDVQEEASKEEQEEEPKGENLDKVV